LEQTLHYVNGEECSPEDRIVRYVEPEDELPVRVVFVPKTAKAPRVIAIEPTAMQYMQQGILRSLESAIETDYLGSRFISWSSQIPNQDLAYRGSLSGSLATLDLSEASDSVSWKLVQKMLGNFPHLFGGVDATRSRRATLPSNVHHPMAGEVIPLAKFASMGSALCFPFEAMVFCTIVFLGIERALGHSLSTRELTRFVDKVRVYGDDIIVPVEFVPSVIDTLSEFGFTVNRSKSFWNGKFRESCGKEYFNGFDVSIVKIRRYFPTSRQDALGVASMVSLCNQFYLAGYWKCVRWLDNQIERLIPFPAVGRDQNDPLDWFESSPSLGKISYLAYKPDGYDQSLQRDFVTCATLHLVIPINSVDGYEALMKFFLRAYNLERESGLDGLLAVDKKHLVRSGRPSSVSIKVKKVYPL